MSATASWTRRFWPEVAWAGFAVANFYVLVVIDEWETVPFHFIWVSLTLVYGFRVWQLGVTLATLAVICVLSFLTYGWLVLNGPQGPDELTEIPLMAAMFLAMVWHARRRHSALEEVRRAAERERQFVRDASHQLKTPVAVARGIAELVRQETSPEVEHDIDDLVEELDRMARVADHLLLLAAAEQRDGLERSAVEVEDLVVDTVRRWSRAAPRRWEVDVTSEGIFPGDRQQLDAALDAILENAVHATCAHERIAIVARAHGDVALIEIADDGTGIADDVIPNVFDRFWSTHYGPDRRRGTGLGLPITKAIVEAHGGTVSIRSSDSNGTVVTVRLPGLTSAVSRNGATATRHTQTV
jgi:two-component system OmpR family sensor kinase